MKLLLGTILTVSLIIISIFILKVFKEKHKLAITVRRLLITGFVVVAVNIISLFTESEAQCLFAYSVYFMATDWLVYFLFNFSIEYIGNEFEKHIKKSLMWLVLLADCIFIFLNNFLEHLFVLKPVTLFDENYYELTVKPPFFIHYGVIIMLVAFCLISLFYRSVNAPVFYRKKYLTIALITVGIVILNIFTMTAAVDLSVAGYVAEAICIYYCTFVYTPKRLLSKTLFRVSQNMSVGLLVMDIEGNKLYSNKYADYYLDTQAPLVNQDGVTVEEWCRKQYIAYKENFTREQSFFWNEEELILKIELQIMVDVHSQLQGGYFVIQDRTEEINALKRERWLASHDVLTGLHNKQYFYDKCAKILRKYPDMELVMICTDIKEFKMINDFLGMATGDTVLKNFAKMLKEKMEGAVAVGRLGNDVFAVMLPKEKYSQELFAYAEKETFFAGVEEKASLPVVTYIGVCEITDRSLPISVICSRACMAIETIKGDYYKRIAYYNNELRDNALYEQELITDLPTAIAEGQLKMYLQPQMSSDGRLLGAEALVRWFHPTKGQIMPGKFIPVFESNGLISNVDRYMWEVACKQLRKWKDEGRTDLYISVNISPRDFYFLNIYQIFMDLVEKYQINPKNLKLEITETAIVMDFQRQLDLITRLRKQGFVVEMDDFGSGYSSLNMLKDLHVDVLKIDMAFLKKARDEERSKKILQMIISLSKNLGMPVITEGVENAEQVDFLTEMGCEMFQGYYFAKPMDISTFEEKFF